MFLAICWALELSSPKSQMGNNYFLNTPVRRVMTVSISLGKNGRALMSGTNITWWEVWKFQPCCRRYLHSACAPYKQRPSLEEDGNSLNASMKFGQKSLLVLSSAPHSGLEDPDFLWFSAPFTVSWLGLKANSIFCLQLLSLSSTSAFPL